jgi:hypothetical protein
MNERSPGVMVPKGKEEMREKTDPAERIPLEENETYTSRCVILPKGALLRLEGT